MIDLHTHTTASDGRCAPDELVDRARAVGVDVLSVTDHDTTAGLDAVEAACLRAGIAFVPGIEITSVAGDVDVHVLGYFIDRGSADLGVFLKEQRRHRADRVRQMVARLAAIGIALDADTILAPAITDSTKAPGRPWVARALVSAGHASDTNDAFARWLSRGRPAFVPRVGPSPAEVFTRIHDAGGVASLAHPGLVKHDDWIPGFAASGLDAIEVWHSDHDAPTTKRYLQMAASLGLLASGGSDYHGEGAHRTARLGGASCPREEFMRLEARAAQALRTASRATASGSGAV